MNDDTRSRDLVLMALVAFAFLCLAAILGQLEIAVAAAGIAGYFVGLFEGEKRVSQGQ